MKKISVMTMFGLIFSLPALFAQQIDPGILTDFQPSVVNRVYEFASRITLQPEKQKKLARSLEKGDSVIARMISTGASASEIALMRKKLLTESQKIVGSAEVNEFYNASMAENAQREGQIMAMLFQENYKSDSSTTGTIANLYAARKIAIEKTFCSNYNDTSVLNMRLYATMMRYDSMIQKYTQVASSKAYIENKIAVLNSVKSLAPETVTKIKKVFTNLSLRSKDRSLADNFYDAMHANITDTVYYAYLFKDEINKGATGSAIRESAQLGKKNKISKDAMTPILPLVFAKRRTLLVIDKTFPVFSKIKDSLVDAANKLYDSLIDLQIAKSGASLQSSQFAIAIRHKKALGLTEAQVDSLFAKAEQLRKMKEVFLETDPYGKYDSKAFETDNMTKIISEDQYGQVLLIKNRSQAKTEAEQDWQEMEQRNLAKDYNKDSTITQLVAYYTAKLSAYYRYGNNPVKRGANVKNIESRMPAALRALTASRKYDNPTNGVQASY